MKQLVIAVLMVAWEVLVLPPAGLAQDVRGANFAQPVGRVLWLIAQQLQIIEQ